MASVVLCLSYMCLLLVNPATILIGDLREKTLFPDEEQEPGRRNTLLCTKVGVASGLRHLECLRHQECIRSAEKTLQLGSARRVESSIRSAERKTLGPARGSFVRIPTVD